MATHSSILGGKSHGQRSLVCYSPRVAELTLATKQTKSYCYTPHMSNVAVSLAIKKI